MMKQFGETFTLYTMKSILKQKEVLSNHLDMLFERLEHLNKKEEELNKD